MKKASKLLLTFLMVTVFILTISCGKKSTGDPSSPDDLAGPGGSVPTGTPDLVFITRNPIMELLYNTSGFFDGSRINFNLVVYDAAGLSSITISEKLSGTTPNGISHSKEQERVIPISGPGTYQLSQEIRNSGGALASDKYTGFTYTVIALKANGKSYTTKYTGAYYSYNGSWNHYFVIN